MGGDVKKCDVNEVSFVRRPCVKSQQKGLWWSAEDLHFSHWFVRVSSWKYQKLWNRNQFVVSFFLMYFQISTGFFEICAFYRTNEIVLSRIFKICVSNFIRSALTISKFYKMVVQAKCLLPSFSIWAFQVKKKLCYAYFFECAFNCIWIYAFVLLSFLNFEFSS